MTDELTPSAAEMIRQQATLARFGEFALRSEDLDEILTEACRLLGDALGTDLAKVVALEDDGKTLLVRAGVGWKPGVVGVARTAASENTSEVHALRSGEPMISPDIEKETRFRYPDFLTDNGVKAVANVPIIGPDGQQAFGILQIDSREPRQFTDNDTAFLSTYANLISAAVNRLRISEDLRDREARLRQSEERFRRIAEIETIGVLFFDGDGRIIDANPAFFHMTGYAEDDLRAGVMTWRALTSPEWQARALQVVDELRTTGQAPPFEKECVRKDGSRWWALCASRMLDEHTAVELVLDITSRKHVEQALSESEGRLRSLVEGIPQLVFRGRSSGERIWGSPQWIAYTGMSEAESLGLGWLQGIHPDDRQATLAAWNGAEVAGMYAVEHRTLRASDATWRWFQTRASPVRDEDGRIIEWFGTSTDIDDQVRAREVLARGREHLEAEVAARTKQLRSALDDLQSEMVRREQAEAALRQSQKMEAIGQLTGGIAHDFNNMLQGVSGSLEMARRRANEGRAADMVRFLDSAGQALERASGLTRRLLAFARRQRLEPKPVDPDFLVTEMADLIRRTMGPGVRLDLQLRDGKAPVLCDPSELENALLNLCINSRDAMPDGGVLTIVTADVDLTAAEVAGEDGAAPGGYVSISVIDTGKGMSVTVVDRAFEPFFTTKPVGHGTGLGLSQVYGFVRQSGGFMQIESATGQGTVVRLLLPQMTDAGRPQLAEPGQGPGEVSPGRTVLLVDDEAIAREAVAEHLRGLGYRVLEAGDGPAALRTLDAGEAIDILVTDVGLPNGLNGRQLAESVRERRPAFRCCSSLDTPAPTCPLGAT